jgi:hypothetical protein
MVKHIFMIIVLIHGLIHFMGFSKAYSYGNFSQLTKEISKPAGIVWFLTGILFLIAIIFYLFKKDSWVYISMLAVGLSQILIINNWQDAKFGTIANLIILIVSVIGNFEIRFKNIYKNEVKIGLEQGINLPEKILTEANLLDLPEPIKKYIRYTGFVGKPKINNFKIKFSGKIRGDSKTEWMPLSSEQYNFIKIPTRLFFMDATMKKLPVAGFHSFKNGIAFMDIRLLSIFNVQYQTGKEMGISETVTFFNDMCCMAPGSLIDKRIEWLKVNGNTVKASFSNNGITIFAWLYFNEKGEMVNFTSEDRYATRENLPLKQYKWSTPLRDYKELNGYKLASYAEAIYSYPEGDFTYATFTLKDVEYNCTD